MEMRTLSATVMQPIESSFRIYKVHQRIHKGSPLAMVLNETGVYPKGDFWPSRRRNSESVQAVAKVTISH